jgi:hypothetical protein
MPGQRQVNSREFYLTSPFGRERWIADRYDLSIERVKCAFEAMELCEFAGSAEVTAEMLNDWPPPLDGPTSKRHSALEKASPPARVVRAKDFGRSLANSDDPMVKAAVDRVRAIEARRARVIPSCCSFCGKTLMRAGTMLESQDWKNPDRLVRICRQCAEMVIVLIDVDTGVHANKPTAERSSHGG